MSIKKANSRMFEGAEVDKWNSTYTNITATSGNWNSVYSSFNAQSAANATVYSTVSATSSNWNSVYSSFNTQSANNAAVYSSVNTASANWNSVYTTVNTNSATTWNYQGTDIKALTGNWENTYTLFSTQSANNASVYSSVTATSGNWNSVYSTVQSNSASAFTKATIGITIDGGGTAITTGSKGYISIPYSCTITNNTIVADQTGSIVIDVKKSTYAGFPTTTSICAAAKPTLTSAQKSTDSTLTGWTTTIAAGDIIEFVVDSAATITKATLTLGVTKT